ncbi:MAG: response regulator [Deltaproteobacteria bacterium]|nr:response regulator [Deltaproteobacteria bacterium]
MRTDDDATRELTAAVLRGEGFEVACAENGQVALEALAESQPDLIVLDLMMPEVDGFHVIAKLQQSNAWSRIPVVVATAMDISATQRAYLEGRVDTVLQKAGYGPFAVAEEVRKLIARVVEAEQADTVSPTVRRFGHAN